MLTTLLINQMTSTSLVLLFFIIIVLIYFVTFNPVRSKLRHLPSPKQGFFLFRLFHEPTGRELEQWLDKLPHNGLIRYKGLWNRERIFAASPEAVKDLLVTEAYKFIKPELQHILANNIASKGLLIQEGAQHKAARKNFQPSFSATHIKRAYPIMWESSFDLVNSVSGQLHSGTTQDGEASLLKPICAASLDIVGRWGFSRDFNAVKDSTAKFPRAYIQMFKTTPRGQRTLYQASIIGPKLALQLPLRAVKTIKRVMAFVRSTAEEIVEEHRQGKSSQTDMLSVAMKTQHFSHKELVDQTVHFLAAATETVAGSVAWAIHLLSRHPDMQARLRDEIRRQLPSPSPLNGRCDIQESHFAEMKYLDAVVREVLRFHSINTILWRECIAPARILDTEIPVGTKVVFSPWALNRDPKYWGPDSREFNPERWLDENKAYGGAENVYSFLAFGAGPRRCIGETYARAQMRCLIAGLVGRFEFAPLAPERESDEGQEIGDQAALTLFKILEGWRIGVKAIEGW